MKKPKKILVDKDFLKLVLKEVKDLQKKVDKKPEIKEVVQPESTANGTDGAILILNGATNQENYLFQCNVVAPYNILPENQLEFNMKVNEFSAELKVLMKKFNYIRSTGEFMAKNIQ